MLPFSATSFCQQIPAKLPHHPNVESAQFLSFGIHRINEHCHFVLTGNAAKGAQTDVTEKISSNNN